MYRQIKKIYRQYGDKTTAQEKLLKAYWYGVALGVGDAQGRRIKCP